MSPAVAASTLVAARACGPSSATRAPRVSGPRELPGTTCSPPAIASRATVAPIIPLPMSPTVVMSFTNRACPCRIPRKLPRQRAPLSQLADGLGPGPAAQLEQAPLHVHLNRPGADEECGADLPGRVA